MKFLLVLASVVAVAMGGLITPGVTGPAPLPEEPFAPIAIGPAVIDHYEPISIGPAIVEHPVEETIVPIAPIFIDTPQEVAPSPVSFEESPAPAPAPASSSPLVQIIVNIQKDVQVNGQDNEVSIPVAPVLEPVPVVGTPVHFVDNEEEFIVPAPIVMPTPEMPEVAPEPIQIGAPVLPPVAPQPIQIGAPELPIVPAPAITLPEELN